MSDSTSLSNELESAFSHVGGISDIAPEHPDGTFTVSTSTKPFRGEQRIRFMDYGVEIDLLFDVVDEPFVPEGAVMVNELEDVKQRSREEIEVTEPRNVENEEGYFTSIRPGKNHDFDGEYDAYPGDVITKEPLGRKLSFYGEFRGCSEGEFDLLDDVVVDEDQIEDGEGASGVGVLSSTGVLSEVVGVVGWVQSFCRGTFGWDEYEIGMTAVDVRVFSDATAVTVTL